MRLVINIPEKLYYKIKSFNVTVSDNIPMANVINDGILLPKEYGNLIDRDNLLQTLNKEHIEYDSDVNYFLCHAPIIIESNKEVE